MAEARRHLGRGLAALLGEATDASIVERPAPPTTGDGAPREIPIDLLDRNEEQPRQVFHDAPLEELAQSIRERGVLQPILVRPMPGQAGRFQIVAGERRWRAAQKAGLHSVPAIVRDLTDTEILEVAIVENVQRTDLDPIEEAYAYTALSERFGHKQEDIARIVGKSRSHVANTLRLMQLSPPIMVLLQTGQITAGHARAILMAPEPEKLAAKVVADELSVRQTENFVRRDAMVRSADKRPRGGGGGGGERAAKGGRGGYDTRALEADLAEMLGLPSVEIADQGGKGKLRLGYGSIEQLDDLCERLTRPVFRHG